MLGADTPLLLVALVAPGFLTIWVAREFAPGSPSNLDATTATVQALAIALGVTALELFFASALSAIVSDAPAWAGLTLTEAVSVDRWAAVREHTGRVALVASTEYLLHLSLFLALGRLFNPIGRLLIRDLANSNLTPADPVQVATGEAALRFGSGTAVARLILDGGRQYSGVVQSVSLQPRADGSRDLFLVQARELREGTWVPVGEGVESGLLVSTGRTAAIEFDYV